MGDINMDDYRTEKGGIDWPRYEKARVNAGEKCNQCGRFMMDDNNFSHRCWECRHLAESKGEREHDSLVRCPKCKETWSPEDTEDYDLFSDGEHDVTCECGHNFEVNTRVEHHFTSPALLPDNEEEEEGDDD